MEESRNRGVVRVREGTKGGDGAEERRRGGDWGWGGEQGQRGRDEGRRWLGVEVMVGEERDGGWVTEGKRIVVF